MSTPFQNRLVGTIIVAAVVIIFLPDVFDGKKKSNQADFDAIPEAPTFTGKITKKPFLKEKLVLKEKPIVSNEQAKDNLLLSNKKTPKHKVNNINVDKAKKTTAANTPKTKKNSAIKKPALGEQPPKAINKEAWAIQLGSFKHKSNVAELVTKLKDNGYTVYTKPIKTKKGTLTKVFVGPELIKSSLTKKLPALKKLTNVQGKVTRFYPTK